MAKYFQDKIWSGRVYNLMFFLDFGGLEWHRIPKEEKDVKLDMGVMVACWPP